jgi:hypothetical protein
MTSSEQEQGNTQYESQPAPDQAQAEPEESQERRAAPAPDGDDAAQPQVDVGQAGTEATGAQSPTVSDNG